MIYDHLKYPERTDIQRHLHIKDSMYPANLSLLTLQTLLVNHWTHKKSIFGQAINASNIKHEQSELKLGLKETRSLSSLYEGWYDPPRVCLYENIGSFLAEQCIPCHLTMNLTFEHQVLCKDLCTIEHGVYLNVS